MKSVALVLALLSAAAGIVAAVYWWRASTPPSVPKIYTDSGDPNFAQQGIAGALVGAGHEAARLNRPAALWTAASVILTALSAIASALADD